jgi:hypothetical protein
MSAGRARGGPARAVADRRAVVHDVERVAVETERLRELVGDAREVRERVAEAVAARHARLAVPGEVAGDDVVPVGEGGMRFRNMCDDVGNPCSRRTVGADFGPASR